MKYKSKEAASN